ncbi:MAG TPA: DUF5063 domain-containing protein [Bacteroidales bacterium]|nr:DUF5063 domain-containing protein [Bacteroidales bacterium]
MTSDLTLSRNVLEMAAVATEYCNFIESAQGLEPQAAFVMLGRFVPLLYLRGTLLPEITPEYPDANERYVTEEQWDGVFLDLRTLFADQDEFPYLGENDLGELTSLNGSISEHLADVYQDMKDFVMLFKKADPAMRENAVAGCRQLFFEHWGPRLARLLPVVHRHLFDETGESTNDFYDIF